MNIISANSPQWADAAHTAIILNVDFEGLGVVPFGASPTDLELHGRDIYTRAVAGEFGAVAAYVAPPVVIPASVTMRQARLALLNAGLLPSVNAAIAAMAGAAGDAARIEWEFAATVGRSSPLIASLATGLGLNSAALDALFTSAAIL